MKTLWIMRHGLAEIEFASDFTRALSNIGEKQVLDVAEQLIANEPILPTTMIVSPFTRTQQTAQIMHQKLAIIEPFENEELLVHFADPRLLGDYLLAREFEQLMIVSHMPIVAELCQYLSPGCNIYGFQTAQIVKLHIAQHNAAKVGNIYYPQEN